MNPLQEQFVSEARELIARASDDLIEMEREGATAARLDQVLRVFHTLKGSAGLVDLPPMTLTMHAAEDLVAGIQSGRLAAATPVITQLFDCLDLVSRWVDAFDAHGELPSRASEDARAMAEQLQAQLTSTGAEPAASKRADIPQWAARLLAARREDMIRRLGARRPALLAVFYEPHAGCFFDGDDPIQLLRQAPNLLALQFENAAFDQPLADLDPFSCSFRFFAIAEGPRDGLASVFRSVPDQVRIIDLPPDALGRVPIEPDGSRIRSIVRAVIAEQREMLLASAQAEGLSGRIGAAARSAANALAQAKFDALAEHVTEAGAAAINGLDPAPLHAVLDHALQVLDREAQVLQPPAIDQQSGPATVAETTLGRQADDATGRFLRVPEARVDALVNLAGELIVLKNRFSHLAGQTGADANGANEVSRALKREQELIERLAGDFHDAIIQLRMVPIGQLLRPFPRLVRDLARQLGKTVQFVTRGEATEFDKAVVDRLFEPLLHLVRNALDHGIETPQARIAAGKGEMGTVSIDAVRAGDRIALDISDDGRGIDLAAVRRKAEASGVMASDALAALSDEQALELIFSAGFSTAGAISDISGRGVGMDVVRKAIDRIGGRVSVTSRPGAGTTVRIDVPVSIATARIMVVECAGQRFGISMDAVSQTVRLNPDRISRIKDNEGFVLHDRVVPICSLAEIMDLPRAGKSDADSRLLMIVEAGAKVAAVEIDAIRDRLDAVLKPMQGLLSSARGYAGTTILGDGSVLLVLDLKEILP